MELVDGTVVRVDAIDASSGSILRSDFSSTFEPGCSSALGEQARLLSLPAMDYCVSEEVSLDMLITCPEQAHTGRPVRPTAHARQGRQRSHAPWARRAITKNPRIGARV